MGGLKAGGRWHYPGQPIVYLSESPASALLEVCVHTASNDVPPDFTLLRIEGPDLPIPWLTEDDLPAEWQRCAEETRDIGTSWLRENRSVLLRIPSAIVPETSNYLFNPLHEDATKFCVAQAYTYPFDSRIKQ